MPFEHSDDQQIQEQGLESEVEYPYQKFLKEIFPGLRKKNKMKYNSLKKEAGGSDPVAFYLYFARCETKKSRINLGKMFSNFKKADVALHPMEVDEYYINLDAKDSFNKNTTKQEYEAVKRVLVKSYGLDGKLFNHPRFKSKS